MRASAFLRMVSIVCAVAWLTAAEQAPPVAIEKREPQAGPAMTIETPHLTVIAASSHERVTPGTRLSLAFEVEPKRSMHVYAPGKHTYRVVGATFDARPWLRVHPMRYPAPEIYFFAPLDERVEVYQKPFTLVQDVTVLATRAAQQQLDGKTSLTISARFEYQACDDKLCYTPQSVPVSWTMALGGN